MISCALVGYGYWGPNIARNIHNSKLLKLTCICDLNELMLVRARQEYPQVFTTNSLEEALNSSVDAVFIATPISTHFMIAKAAISKGKHVWIEKPLTDNVSDALELIHDAGENNVLIHVDHTFCYTGAVRQIKNIVQSDAYGDPYYYDSKRVNLGLFQRDASVFWDLAIHDLSIVDYVYGFSPSWVNCIGTAHVEGQPIDTGIIVVGYHGGFTATISVSWLSPVKIRQTLLAGTKKMIVYDDLDIEAKIKVYDRGVSFDKIALDKTKQMTYRRTGDIWCPQYSNMEALSLEMEEFCHAICNSEETITSCKQALTCIAILESAHQSLKEDGRRIQISEEYLQ